MSEELTPRQQILLWDLISRGGSALQKDLKCDAGPSVRDFLARTKLISVSKVKNNANLLTIEEPGWNHIASIAPTLTKSGEGSKYDRPILQFILAKVQAYAAANGLAYADVFGGPAEEAGGGGETIPSDPPLLPLVTVIRSAFFDLAGRPPRDGVRLRALREKLPNIDRAVLDAALLDMRKSGAANLTNLDNPRDIEAEGDAPLKAGGQTFHLLWINP